MPFTNATVTILLLLNIFVSAPVSGVKRGCQNASFGGHFEETRTVFSACVNYKRQDCNKRTYGDVVPT